MAQPPHCGLTGFVGSCLLLVMFSMIQYIKAFSWRGDTPGEAMRAFPSGWPAWLRGHCGRWCRRTRAGCLSWLGPWGQHEAAAEEIEARAAKHLPLEHFEAVDVPLDRSIGPRQRHAGFDGRVVVPEPGGKALPGVKRTGRRPLQPRIKVL